MGQIEEINMFMIEVTEGVSATLKSIRSLSGDLFCGKWPDASMIHSRLSGEEALKLENTNLEFSVDILCNFS